MLHTWPQASLMGQFFTWDPLLSAMSRWLTSWQNLTCTVPCRPFFSCQVSEPSRDRLPASQPQSIPHPAPLHVAPEASVHCALIPQLSWRYYSQSSESCAFDFFPSPDISFPFCSDLSHYCIHDPIPVNPNDRHRWSMVLRIVHMLASLPMYERPLISPYSYRQKFWPGMVVHTFNLNTRENCQFEARQGWIANPGFLTFSRVYMCECM